MVLSHIINYTAETKGDGAGPLSSIPQPLGSLGAHQHPWVERMRHPWELCLGDVWGEKAPLLSPSPQQQHPSFLHPLPVLCTL